MSQNLIEKIAQKYAVDLEQGHVVKIGRASCRERV